MRARFVASEVMIGLRRNFTMTMALIVTIAISLALLGTGLLVRQQMAQMHEQLQQSQAVLAKMHEEIQTQQATAAATKYKTDKDAETRIKIAEIQFASAANADGNLEIARIHYTGDLGQKANRNFGNVTVSAKGDITGVGGEPVHVKGINVSLASEDGAISGSTGPLRSSARARSG